MVAAVERGGIQELGKAIFSALRKMDRECATGLCDYVSASPFAGQRRKNEAALAWGITRHLQHDYLVQQAEHSYGRSRKRCDRVVELSDGRTVWLEMKHAWRVWCYDGVHRNAPFFYSGYWTGLHHSHSVAGDFRKMESLESANVPIMALLIVGFDGTDAVMAEDMDRLASTEKLVERGWHVIAADPWSAKGSTECWHRCWFWWREVTDQSS